MGNLNLQHISGKNPLTDEQYRWLDIFSKVFDHEYTLLFDEIKSSGKYDNVDKRILTLMGNEYKILSKKWGPENIPRTKYASRL